MYEIFEEKINNVLSSIDYDHSIHLKYFPSQLFLTVTKYLKKISLEKGFTLA